MTVRYALVAFLVACGAPPQDAAEARPAPPPAPAPAVEPAAAPPVAGAPQTEEEKVLYALGQSVGMSLSPFQLTPADLAMVVKGLEDEINGRPPAVPLETYGAKLRELAASRAAAAAGANAAKSAEFLKKISEEAGASVSPTGVVYVETKAGAGASPKPTDGVTVHYRGTLADGSEFDSSYKRGSPAQFPLNGVIPCWTEGLQKMKVGGKATLGCPASLAYGDSGQGDIPPGSALKFEVELIAIGS